MKNSLTLLIYLGICLATLSSVRAQLHDFDSLWNQSAEFRKVSQAIGDTIDLFNGDQMLFVTFESDFKALVRNKYNDEYQDALIRLKYNDTIQLSRKIRIKPRGNMRKSACHIPPLTLKFPKATTIVRHIKEFNKMKMVLDCKNGEIYQQYLLSEYYAYKIQHIITPYSLRVRLVHVTYIDTGRKLKENIQYAFLIESIDQAAERLNAVRIKAKNIKATLADQKTLADVYLFQYLIGNTDWSIPASHNIYTIKSKDPTVTRPYVIPYDFDYSGLVNARYAVPHESLGIESVRERVYRGTCLPDNVLFVATTHIMDKKEKIYRLFEDDRLLNKRNKHGMINYVNEFFRIIESDKSLRNNIIKNCR